MAIRHRPTDIADELEDLALQRGGFDSIKTTVTLNDYTWTTSMFPSTSHNSLILPVKRDARSHAHNVTAPDPVTLTITINTHPLHP